MLGFAGAYLRYLLSFCNPIYPEFPIGTFVVNVTGTWLLAAFTTISHYVVDYYDADLQAVMFGLSTGFCGCLTTVSTFVAEIDHLQTAVSGSAAYKYAIVSNVFAQIGIIFIYNIYAFQTVPTSSLAQPSSISQCATNQILCEELLHRIACPIAARNNVACTNGNDDSSFIGNCSCGSFVGDRVTELICDAQVKGNGTNNLVPIWPKYAKQMNDPSQTIDYCLTFQVSQYCFTECFFVNLCVLIDV